MTADRTVRHIAADFKADVCFLQKCPRLLRRNTQFFFCCHVCCAALQLVGFVHHYCRQPVLWLCSVGDPWGGAGFKTRLLPVWIIMPSASQGQLKWKREPHFASHRKHKASRVSGVSWFIPSSWNRSTVSTAEEQTQMFAVVFKRWLLVHVVACCTLISTVLVGGIYLRNSWRITFRLLINKATIRVAARFVVFNAKREWNAHNRYRVPIWVNTNHNAAVPRADYRLQITANSHSNVSKGALALKRSGT